MFENLASATGSKSKLPEKGDTSAMMSAQVKLGTILAHFLKILLNKIVMNAGESEPVATHSDPHDSTKSPAFREDLLPSDIYHTKKLSLI